MVSLESSDTVDLRSEAVGLPEVWRGKQSIQRLTRIEIHTCNIRKIISAFFRVIIRRDWSFTQSLIFKFNVSYFIALSDGRRVSIANIHV